MGVKKLSKQEEAEAIASNDYLVAICSGGLKKAEVQKLFDQLNTNFDIEEVSESEDDYRLKITLGENTVTTPNLKTSTLKSAEVKNGHLFVYMSDGQTIDAGVVEASDIKTYGFNYNEDTLNPTLTRLGDAKYLVPAASLGTEIVHNDFDSVYPLSGMRRCNLADDGTVNAYEGDATYKADGTNGQVMVQIPKYYRYVDGTTRYFAKEKINSNFSAPKAFIDKNGNELDYIYIAAYLMTTEDSADEDYTIGCSKSGNGMCYETDSFVSSRESATNRGTNWHLFDIWEYEVLKDLFMLEWGTTNSQSIFYGAISDKSVENDLFANEDVYTAYVGSSETQTAETELDGSFLCESNDYRINDYVQFETVAIPAPEAQDDTEGAFATRRITAMEEITINDTTVYKYYFSGSSVTVQAMFLGRNLVGMCGETDDIKSSSGKFEKTEEVEPFVWRGLENLYGVKYTFIDGILCYSGKYWVCSDISKYASTTKVYDDDGNETTSPYTELTMDIPSSNGYISKMGYDVETGISMPTETEADSVTGYCDNFTKSSRPTLATSVRFGGYTGVQCGLFYLPCPSSATAGSASAARLSYRHYK